MKKVCVVMTHYKRVEQLKRTLFSIERSFYKNINVIIVDDASDEPLPDLKTFSYPIDVIYITKEEKQWTNPEVAYNKGIIKALSYSPDVIIIQNAETMHIGDVISHAIENITNENYIVYSCLSLDKSSTFDESVDVEQLANTCKHEASSEGQIAWYHHPTYRPCYLDFCAAISTSNMIKINGYDERFIYGIAYGDNYLKYRIESLGLKFETPSFPFTAHQWHYEDWYWKKRNGALYEKNHLLFSELMKDKQIKAEHIITPNFEDL